MTPMFSRRTFLVAGATALASRPAFAATAEAQLASLEASSGGRLGVYAFRLGAEHVAIAHRASERFPMCSTFKALAVAAVLRRVDERTLHLDAAVAYGPSDVLSYAPVTRANVARGAMSLGALCAAAIEYSDNTAANLLLRTLGGPGKVTAFAREALRDPVTRLDRTEPTLNTAIPGDPRDTTSPTAMSRNLAALFGNAGPLSAASAGRLRDWMERCKTGTHALRAGLPAGAFVADKTGTGRLGTHNDIAFVRPHTGAPFAIAAYLTGATRLDDDGRDAALASVARIVAENLR